jgi:hypothetical protein
MKVLNFHFPNIVLSTPYRYFAQYGIPYLQKTETSYFYITEFTL